MRVLALEPYYGGSHRAFLEGWSKRSRHDWTILGHPPYKWKWRMRNSAVFFAEETRERFLAGERWDRIFCSDMLNLAEFLGLARDFLAEVPAVAYFHENQLTYPKRSEDERDYQFVMTNLTTAIAADEVWFNSAYHRDSFLDGMEAFLKKMPDTQPVAEVDRIRGKARVYSQGIDEFPARPAREPGPVRLLWAARWEHDKAPEAFFEALEELDRRGIRFRISVIGEQFRDCPGVFETARERFGDRIERWGYQESRADYIAALSAADVIVSTAIHEFFGISVVEAAAAGAFPVLPRRLSYPEVFEDSEEEGTQSFFYGEGKADLADKLERVARLVEDDRLWGADPGAGIRATEKYLWKNLVPRLDDSIARIER